MCSRLRFFARNEQKRDTDMCVHIFMYMYVYIFMYMYTHMYIHIYMHMYLYMCSFRDLESGFEYDKSVRTC